MAGKLTGLGDNFYIGGYDISGDVNSLGKIGGGPNLLNLTGIDKSAWERGGGVMDAALEFVSYWNVDAGQAHARLSLAPRTDVQAAYCRGTTLGNAAACLVGKQASYSPSRDDAGNLRCAVALPANGFGMEWGVQLTAGKRTDGSATNGTGVDFTSASTFGLQAYLQVFSVVGTSVTVKLQESSDNAVGDPYADVTGGAFSAVTPAGSPTVQRIATSAVLSVERWLRVVTTGTFSSAVFSVVVARNLTATVF
jgi:hypothetical protein